MAETISADKDLAMVGRVRTLFEQARQDRRDRVEDWNRAYKAVHNRAWSPLRDSWMPSPTASEIYPILAALVGWMTDQRTKFQVIPAMNPHSPAANFLAGLAHDLEVAMKANWEIQNHDAEVEKVVFDAMIYGTGFFKCGWNAALMDGLGDVTLDRIDPFRMYPDPNGTNMEDMNYIIEARTMSMQELDRRWPGSVAKLNEEADEDSSLDRRDDTHRSGRVPMANPGGVNGALPLWGRPGQARDTADMSSDDAVTVYECWMRENEQYTNEEGDVYIEDAWRVVVTTGNMVLMNESAIDVFGFPHHPYTRYVLHDLGDFWGMSLVDHLMPLQTSLNRLLASVQSNAELIGNPVFREDSRSGIPRTKITNRPGTRLTTQPGAEVGWLNPPEMPRYVQELMAFYIGEMERISGLSAMVRGATPGGRNAQGVLDAVQEAAFVRVRLAIRNLERSLRSIGQMAASLVVDNYTTPRLVAVAGPQGEKTTMALQGFHFMVQGEDDKQPLQFQLLVEAGSSLPISRQARSQEADVLFAMGAIDVQAVLEAHDYPNRAEIAQRVQQQQTQASMGMAAPPGAQSARSAAGRTG